MGLESNGSHRAVELYLPNCLLALEINYRGGLTFQRSANRVLTIGREKHVMYAAVHGDALHAFKRSCIDHIDNPWFAADTNQHPASVFGNRQVVRTSAQRHFLKEFPEIGRAHV